MIPVKVNRVLVAVAMAFAVGFLTVASQADYVVPAVALPKPGHDFSQTERDFLLHTLKTVGIVAITDIPGFKELRNDCLKTMAQCYLDGKLETEATLTVELADGTKRVTLAAGSGANSAALLGCPSLVAKFNRMRSLIDEVSYIFADGLDGSILVEEEKPLFMASNNPDRISYPDFKSVVQYGAHLDHLHVYEKGKEVDSDNEALEKHVDHGLFIAIVPAMSFMLNGEVALVADGFEIEMSYGRFSRVAFPDGGNSLVFMMGDGISNFINAKAVRTVRPTPHRLVVRETDLARVWFGRMFFPPQDAYLYKQQTSFNNIRLASIEMGAKNVGFQGCSSHGQVLRDLAETACQANEHFCWMQCMSTVDLTCASDETIQCLEENGQIHVDEDVHCFTCNVGCYHNSTSGDTPSTSNITSTTASDGICNVKIPALNMYMDGFNLVAPNVNCLVFLFKSWVMDTKVKLAFGSIGSFLIGMFVEFVVFLRREVKRNKYQRRNRCLARLPDARAPRTVSVLLVSFYATQLVFAYFAMLLAMSFSSLIFSMIMLGFVAGHIMFNFEAPAGTVEACCAANESVHGDEKTASSNDDASKGPSPAVV